MGPANRPPLFRTNRPADFEETLLPNHGSYSHNPRMLRLEWNAPDVRFVAVAAVVEEQGLLEVSWPVCAKERRTEGA